jgi:hypothetical protein
MKVILGFFYVLTIFYACFYNGEAFDIPKCDIYSGAAKKHTDTFKVQTDMYMDQEDGCLKFNTRILYVDKDGQSWLKHSAIMKTGKGCITELLDEDHEGNGPYKCDWIIEDKLLDGKVRDFFDAHPLIYSVYTIKRDSLIKVQLKSPVPKHFSKEPAKFEPKDSPTNKLTITTEIYKDQQAGCRKLLVSIYSQELNSQQVWLLYRADVKAGKDCIPNEVEVNQLADGLYKGDWILKEYRYKEYGSIRDYFDTHPDIYKKYATQRDSILKKYPLK